MYLVTYRVEQDKLPAFMNAANPHGTMRRCGPETEDFEVSHNELETIGQDLDNILQRLQTILLHLQRGLIRRTLSNLALAETLTPEAGLRQRLLFCPRDRSRSDELLLDLFMNRLKPMFGAGRAVSEELDLRL